jgi:hypothetical protein
MGKQYDNVNYSMNIIEPETVIPPVSGSMFAPCGNSYRRHGARNVSFTGSR